MSSSSMIRTVSAITAMLISFSASASTLYGVTFSRELVSLDPLTGNGSLIGNLGVSADAIPYGLGEHNGELYLLTTTTGKESRMHVLDTATGLAKSSVATPGIATGEGSLAISPSGEFYATSSTSTQGGSLYAVNPTGGAVALTATMTSSIDGADFLGTTFYGVSQSSADLFTIDPSSGAQVLLGSLSASGTTILNGLTFDDAGVGYTIIRGVLYSFDPLTAATTEIGSTGFGNDISGLSWAPDPIPEPSTFVLTALGLLVLRAGGRSADSST